jgi:glycosyltransferase involved in cell wall biosynthesis
MNKIKPDVSVIIPTYNRAKLVSRAIKSVLAQTYYNFELIVIDDASTDNTKNIIANFQDKRISYIRQKKNKGAPAARNTGIKLAKGLFIAFLDDDDEILPAKIEKQVNKFSLVSKKVGLIYSGSELIEEKDNSILKVYTPKYKGNVQQRLLLGPTICGSHTALIRKKCFERVGGFDEMLKSCQDWDMWKRISEYFDFDFVAEILSRTYLHQHQISSDFSSLIPGRIRMIEKHMEDFRKNPDILVIHLKRLGKLNCLNGTYKEAIYWFRKATDLNKIEIAKILAWCILNFPREKRNLKKKKFKRYYLKRS